MACVLKSAIFGEAQLTNPQPMSKKMAAREESDLFNLSEFDVYDSHKDELYLPHGSSEDEGTCITLQLFKSGNIRFQLSFSHILVAVWHRHIWLSDFKHEIR